MGARAWGHKVARNGQEKTPTVYLKRRQVMKARFLVLMIGLLSFPALAGDVTGVWKGQITDRDGNPHDLVFNLKADGNKLTGTVTGAPPTGAEQTIVTGKVDGDQLSFETSAEGPDGNPLKLTYTGKVTGNQMQGSMGSPMGSLSFTVTKK
jgi:hypothetical protein